MIDLARRDAEHLQIALADLVTVGLQDGPGGT
jgi:hypothetical protein